MAVDEELMIRIRPLLADQRSVREKRMFSGVTFMVNGKMCVAVGKGRILCRIDPSRQQEALSRDGCGAMKMKGKELRGWVYVEKEALHSKKILEYWVQLALDFNKNAKRSRKK